MIKLKEGQKVIAEDGSVYEIEKGDLIESTLNENYPFMNDINKVVNHTFNGLYDLAFEDYIEFIENAGQGKLTYEWFKKNK